MWIGQQVVAVRTAIRWTQTDLGRRIGVVQSVISDIEAGAQPDLTLRRAEQLFEAMGARIRLSIDPPRVAEAAVRDPVHIRCSAHVVRRLTAAGWDARTEVEVGGQRSRGWIDILAYRPTTRAVMVIEVKTEIRDVGELERTLSWYEREAWIAARLRSWRPRNVGSVVLVLATEENERITRDLRAVLADRFPIRATALTQFVAGAELLAPGRAIAMIDPKSRRQVWIRPLRIDGRRSDAPYRDYLDAVRRLQG